VAQKYWHTFQIVFLIKLLGWGGMGTAKSYLKEKFLKKEKNKNPTSYKETTMNKASENILFVGSLSYQF